MAGFIVFEGLDGTGKSTKLDLAAKLLYENGKSVHCTAEPTDSPVGRLLRSALAGGFVLPPAAAAALFTADRIDHCAKEGTGIRDRLSRGEYVLSSRYYYSTLAYQGMDCPLETILPIAVNPAVIKPDLCIFLDAPASVCAERIARRAEETGQTVEIFEKESVLERVRESFYRVFEVLGEENIVIVNTDCPPEEANARVAEAILGVL
ncbi:MAG: dTMP kinase [Clostridia bacterium]|nr:dTMP kinase [Clostridia bacterium]